MQGISLHATALCARLAVVCVVMFAYIFAVGVVTSLKPERSPRTTARSLIGTVTEFICCERKI